jgi:pimeloyl-ACP methyl ester carboxylesterase
MPLSPARRRTFAAQIFLSRHPEAVRTVVLSSVVKPGEPAPLNHARNAQQALELLARHFQEEGSTVFDRLAKQPVKVQVKNPTTGKPVTASR